MLTTHDVLTFLQDVGIRQNDKVTIHCSLRSIGKIENGADGLIDAFRSYLLDGLFIVPTHTWDTVVREHPFYDVRTTVPCIGTLAKVAAFRPDAVRSLHPTHSVAVFGKNAAEYVQGEENSASPAPVGGCLSRLYEENGKVLLIGVGHDKNTYLHAVDERLQIPDRLNPDPFVITIKDYHGNTLTSPPFHTHYTAAANTCVSEYYPNYKEAFEYAKWDLSVFPCIPTQFKLAAKSETVACARLVRGFLKQADWVINATDPDREGELIFSYVYQACGCHAPVMRVWIEDLTDAKIQKAFANLIAPDQPISPQNPGTPNDLQAAGRARDIADWLIGNNLTVAATKKFGNYEELLSVGRVQTPTLALVVEREKAIRNFVKAPFWKLTADFTTPAGEHFEAEYSGGKFDKQEDAQKLLTQCGNHPGTVKQLETKRRTQIAPLLYNATQLQIAETKNSAGTQTKPPRSCRVSTRKSS